MPSPGFGDNFFLMARDNARFSEMYHVAEASYGREIGCVAPRTAAPSRWANGRAMLPRGRRRRTLRRRTAAGNRVFVQRRRNATSRRAPSGNRLDVAPYRFFYDMCKRFRPLNDDPRVDPGVADMLTERPLSCQPHRRPACSIFC